MDPSWNLEIFFLQVTSYKAPFKQVSRFLFTLLIFVASIECPDSATLTGKKKYCTTFKLCGSIRLG